MWTLAVGRRSLNIDRRHLDAFEHRGLVSRHAITLRPGHVIRIRTLGPLVFTTWPERQPDHPRVFVGFRRWTPPGA